MENNFRAGSLNRRFKGFHISNIALDMLDEIGYARLSEQACFIRRK
jgi:hypothetical protein